MKKSILLAFLAVALSASAGSINWQLNTLATSNYMVGEDGNKLNGTAYLVLTDAYEAATIATLDDITGLALGGADGGVTITDGINKNMNTATDSRLIAPTEYSFTVLFYDTANGSFYASAARSNATYNKGADLDHYGGEQEIKFTAAQVFATAAKRNTQQWHAAPAVSVPEPSSAALALAGLALLLKRRRA